MFSTVLPSTASQPNASLTVSFAQQVAVHCKVSMRAKIPQSGRSFLYGYSQHYVCQYPFIHQHGERHCESSVLPKNTIPCPPPGVKARLLNPILVIACRTKVLCMFMQKMLTLLTLYILTKKNRVLFPSAFELRFI